MNFVSKRIFVFVLSVIGPFILHGEAIACSCESYGQPRGDAKKYYRTVFDGSIFTGTIIEIKHDPRADDGGITYSELQIEVEEYWLGVKNSTLSVFVAGPNTSCYVDWKVKQKTFFIAQRMDGKLYYSNCDLANWGGTYPKSDWSKYTNTILGKPQKFAKTK